MATVQRKKLIRYGVNWVWETIATFQTEAEWMKYANPLFLLTEKPDVKEARLKEVWAESRKLAGLTTAPAKKQD